MQADSERQDKSNVDERHLEWNAHVSEYIAKHDAGVLQQMHVLHNDVISNISRTFLLFPYLVFYKI